jgi:SAM-dependent methyltransferase
MNESPQHAPGDALLDAYEEVAYVGRPNRNSHPDRMATIATLLGMNPAPPASCRVLELACGDGANLIPVAASLPGSTFVGIDFAPSAIAHAQRMAAGLNLTNIEFLALDLRAFPESVGAFDYIIAHGLYSWVPAAVRERVLPLVARHLAPNGVAFVSYNTFPGCHIRRALWEMLKYHTRNVPDHRAKLVAARSLISLLSDPASTHQENDAFLRQELRNMSTLTDSALAHDDLSEPNDPVYFHEFVAGLERDGLTFLAEAELHSMVGSGITPRVRQALGKMDRLTREQYLDFVHFRRFRQSLACRAGVLSRFVVEPSRARPMHASASRALLRLAKEGNVADPDDHPDVRALKELLMARWPRSIPMAELAAWYASRARKSAEGAAPPAAIETLVVRTYAAGLLELRLQPPAAVATAGTHPTAFAPARWQARDADVVTNLYHEEVNVSDPLQRDLLLLLDGTRTRGQLVAEAGTRLTGADRAGQVQWALDQLAHAALLVA